MCQTKLHSSIVKEYLLRVMAIKIHIAIKPDHLKALHYIRMHTGQPSVIKSWRATKGLVLRGCCVLQKLTINFLFV